MKRGWIAFGFAFVALVVIGAAFGGEDRTTTSTTRQATPEEQAAAAARAAEQVKETTSTTTTTTAKPTTTTTLSPSEQAHAALAVWEAAEAELWSAVTEGATLTLRCSALTAWLDDDRYPPFPELDYLPVADLDTLSARLEAQRAEADLLEMECAAEREAREAEREAREAEREAREAEERAAAAARLRMTVDEIDEQIEANALRFEREFLGESLTVTGKVGSITTRDDKAFVTLGDWRTAEVVCTMRSEAGLLDLEAGDTVTLRGRFDDLANYTEEVEMAGCQIL